MSMHPSFCIDRRKASTGLLACLLVGLLPGRRVAAATRTDPSPAAPLTAAKIVEHHLAARGGLTPWRDVATMKWTGHIESANSPYPVIPFVLETQRPDKTRFELRTDEVKSVRAYDGKRGWMLRQTRHSGTDVHQLDADAMRQARQAPGLEGVLVEHAGEDLAIALEGSEDVDGHTAYRLAVTLPTGAQHHVWIDVLTYLDIKYDRISYGPGGRPGTVAIINRAFKTFDGLRVPTTIEIGVSTAKVPDRMIIENVEVNPHFDDRIFAMPRQFAPSNAGATASRAR
jgi:hypothetical protein